MTLKKTILTTLLLSSISPLLLLSHTTHAGVDFTCSPNFNVDGKSYDACSNVPVLIPSNDNQVNMSLLLSDLGLAELQPIKGDTDLWTSTYAQVPFEADTLIQMSKNKVNNARQPTDKSDDYLDERCRTLASGKSGFIQQVQNNKNISSNEKQQLISARKKITGCGEKIALLAVNPQWSITARQYASYLNASIAFYNANYAIADKIYAVLSTVDDTWLKETAQYMLIRTRLNLVFSSGVGQYGDLDLSKINPADTQQLLGTIRNYLKMYPNGQYAASARGYLRRAFWLGGQQPALINELVWQIQNPKSPYYNLDMQALPAEIDRQIFGSSKFKASHLSDPFFLATYDLMMMRESQSEGYKPIGWTQLTAQKNHFQQQPELFQYLQATHLLYLQNKPREALTVLTALDNTKQPYLQLSQRFLKGKILDQISPTQAETYWREQLAQAKRSDARGLFELALMPYLIKKQEVAAFIGKNPTIRQLNLQKNFIVDHANPNALQQMIKSNQANNDQKQAALFTLLSKSLTHQNYSLFNQYYRELPADAAQYKSFDGIEKYKDKAPFSDLIWNGTTISPQLKCPNLPTLTQQLEKSPKDPLLNVCMGEYNRAHHFGWQYDDSESTTLNDHFEGPVFARGNVYKSLIRSNQKSELQAYALYRAIMCYSPSGMNDCGDSEVAKPVRKQWYDQIKRDYPNTSWAKSLKYYW
ncbi:hypothetical protein [Acinetobacter sp. MD2(2019)]|uniref:hypothetical protein n=1 Tax=Acinetobacter sp. MD2(2019) TaxID=2605273 RepID=UPI002D1F4014|nr:hypothetical protein [Acinetobacter sp. MD2(2019)]MEB3752919.1 hypothetical protein [Acinetobacter sp. MD2(2019)]